MDLDGIDHVAISVRDVARSAQWYGEVLGFEKKHEDVWEIPTFISKGTTAIALFPAGSNSPARVGRSRPPQFLHLAFRTNGEGFLQAQEELKKRKIAFEFQDHEIAHSIYFSDPDGHPLEITTYEVERR